MVVNFEVAAMERSIEWRSIERYPFQRQALKLVKSLSNVLK